MFLSKNGKKNPAKEFLKEIFIFRDLSELEILFVTQVMTRRIFHAGETIMVEGEPGDSMYVIAEGEVQVSKALTMKFGDNDFRELDKMLSTFKAEDRVVFGEMGLVTEAPRSATISAITECTLYEITREDFLRLTEDNPVLGFKIMLHLAEILAQRLNKSGEDVIRLTTALSIALSQ